VRCPSCEAVDDKVVDSRLTDGGSAIRRRRECLGCGQRFTTFERSEDAGVVVVKRSGRREAFQRTKVLSGMRRAAKNRPIEPATLEALAAAVEDDARSRGAVVSSDDVGRAVLERLRDLDEVTYLRFASVYMGFENATDFAREAGLLRKATAPKERPLR
jgi:transcriptional repressor NrdR